MAAGVNHPHFTLIAERQDHPPVDDSGIQSLSNGEPYEIDVIVANASVRPDTWINDGNGNVSPASAYDLSSKTLLVAGNHNAGDFALLVVSRDRVDGMARREGEDPVKVQQSPGGHATVTAQQEFIPPANWTCDVGEDDGDPDASAVQPGEASRRGLVVEAEDLFGTDHGHDHHDHHGHDHHGLDRHGHDHHGHYHHDHDHRHNHHDHAHDFNSNDMLSQLRTDLKQNNANLRNISSSRRALYPTDNFPKLYSYEVDMYIEIDQLVVDRNTNLTGAVAYVNALVSAASVIFEKEVDTHRELIFIPMNIMFACNIT